jgi:hypothetical protein
MVIDMNETQLKTVAQLRAFLNGTPDVQFHSIGDDTKRYEFIAAVLKRLCYPRLGRAEKGVVFSEKSKANRSEPTHPHRPRALRSGDEDGRTGRSLGPNDPSSHPTDGPGWA